MGWFALILLLLGVGGIIIGIKSGDFGAIAMGALFFGLPGAAIAYFKLRIFLPDPPDPPKFDPKVEEQRVRQLAPPRPAMTVPAAGNITVAFQQTDDAVWVWIDLSETAKHILSDAQALNIPVDEYYLNSKSEELRKMLRDIDDLEESEFYTHRDKKEEKLRRTEQWNAPQYVTLREILANPHRHYERDPQKRLEYIEKLKNKILPKVKSIIEGHPHSKSGSFEL